MIDIPAAAAIVEIAHTHRAANRPLPPHLAADLRELADDPTLPPRFRTEARRLLERNP
jgi:hypothetical protein